MYSGHSCSLWILFTLHWLFTLATTPRELYLPKKRWCRILTLERCANISPMWLCNEYWPHYWWYKVDALIATMYGKNRQQLCTPFLYCFFIVSSILFTIATTHGGRVKPTLTSGGSFFGGCYENGSTSGSKDAHWSSTCYDVGPWKWGMGEGCTYLVTRP